ncbi:MAG: acyl-CoA--6-aminopenicillanic acid acyltransferase [Flavobacteriales bacterium]|jgi:predicted choloylglycine hydrolase|nr:acyl-CoA--6-aminopenicillanic acid acyltransferase [Flavobacteriales bacterium]
MYIHLKLIHEPQPSERWQRFFHRVWPLYLDWFVSEGHGARPGRAESRDALAVHMPELLPTYDSLCELAGGGDLEARFLSMWCPPPYMAGCSQAAWVRGNPTLVRNYDYDPRFFDGQMCFTEWLKPVISIQDSAWGSLDGMNADGLAVALAFGGRKVSGIGFGIPLVVRYILETCSTTEEAMAVVGRIPVHMSYNVIALDKNGHYAVAYLNPDRPAKIVHQPVCTNHQGQVEWDEYAAFTQTLERNDYLEELLRDENVDRAQLLKRFLKPPLYHQQYLRGFGTLYSVAYDLKRKRVRVFWPDRHIEVGFNSFEEQDLKVVLLRPAGRYMAK